MKNQISDLTTKNTSDVRLTPDWILEDIVYPTLGQVDVDPTAESTVNPNVKAKNHFTEEHPATVSDLVGKVFMNPPFSQTKKFLGMINQAISLGFLQSAIVLVKFDSRTAWMQSQVWDSPWVDWIYFCRYVKFKTSDHEEMISAPFSVCLISYNKGGDWEKFYQVTSQRFDGKTLPVSMRACKYVGGLAGFGGQDKP